MEITSENAKFNETWCRTCNEKTNIIFLHSLEERAGSCPSLANMLLEITGINTNIDSSPKFLPKYICGNCTYKLNVAYGFMIQAKRVNKQFLANLHNSSNEEFKLEELQIDEESVKIKIETFIGDDASEIHDVVNANVNDLESCYKSDLEKSNLNLKGTVDSASNFNCKIKTELLSFEVQDETSNLNTASEILDPISVAETHWNIDKTDAEFKSMNDKECLKSPAFKKQIKLRHRGRPPIEKPQSCDGRFYCNVCEKTFAWKKDLQRHQKSHFGLPDLECEYCDRKFFRKDKLNNHIRTHQKNNAY